jgi:hypothetical protein
MIRPVAITPGAMPLALSLGPSETTRRAGHDRDLPVQLSHGGSPLLVTASCQIPVSGRNRDLRLHTGHPRPRGGSHAEKLETKAPPPAVR